MIAFEVYLNNEKLCLAGVGEDGVLSSSMHWVSREGEDEMFLHVGGLITEIEKHVRWVNQKPLNVGDMVQIKVVDSQDSDPPLADQD